MYSVYVGSGLQMLTYASIAPTPPDTDSSPEVSLYVFRVKDFIRLIISSMQSSIMRGIGAGERIFEVLDRRPAIPPGVGIPLERTRVGRVRFENVANELI